jgi:hypothetical protein
MKKPKKLRSLKAGMPPGSPIHIGEIKTAKPSISVLDFGPGVLIETELPDTTDLASYVRQNSTLWGNIYGLQDPVALSTIGSAFHLHPLVLEDKLSASTAHDRLMAKWRRCTNTLQEFIHEECVLSPDGRFRRSDFYRDYASWCSDNGRKPFSKGRVKELLEHNIGLDIRLVELDGYEVFRGLAAKSFESAPGAKSLSDQSSRGRISVADAMAEAAGFPSPSSCAAKTTPTKRTALTEESFRDQEELS